MDARARALELVEQWQGELRRLLPADADVFDAHLHLGHDIDGMVGDYDQLEAIMREYGISRAFMFCLDEPDRHPAFSAANDRTLAFAKGSGGRPCARSSSCPSSSFSVSSKSSRAASRGASIAWVTTCRFPSFSA